jgi:hypothetical protein
MSYANFWVEDTIIRKKPNKIIKQACCNLSVAVSRIEKIIRNQIKKPDGDIVKLFNFKKLSSSRGRTRYMYTMERLFEISKEDKLIVSKWFRGRRPKKNSKLKEFLYRAHKKGYGDLHEDNVMIDRYGDYKLIDIEGFVHNIDF